MTAAVTCAAATVSRFGSQGAHSPDLVQGQGEFDTPGVSGVYGRNGRSSYTLKASFTTEAL